MQYTVTPHRLPGLDGFTFIVRASCGRLVGRLRSVPSQDECAELDQREQRVAALRAEVDAKRPPPQPAPQAFKRAATVEPDRRRRRRTNLRSYPPAVQREARLIYNREFQRAQKKLPPDQWSVHALSKRREYLDGWLAQQDEEQAA